MDSWQPNSLQFTGAAASSELPKLRGERLDRGSASQCPNAHHLLAHTGFPPKGIGVKQMSSVQARMPGPLITKTADNRPTS